MKKNDMIYFATLIDKDHDLLLVGKNTQYEIANNILCNKNVDYKIGAGKSDIDLIVVIEIVKSLFEAVKIAYDLYSEFVKKNDNSSQMTVEDIISIIINLHGIDDENKIILLKAIINKDRDSS